MEELAAQDIRELEKRVLNDTVTANRTAAVIVATVFAALAILMFSLQHLARPSAGQFLLLTWFALGLLAACPVVMMLRPKEDAYPVVRFWVGLVGVLITAQICNYIFGADRDYFMKSGWPPFLLISIPIYLILARTFLISVHARRAQIGFLLALGAADITHTVLLGDQFEARYGMIMLSATIWLYGPMVILFLEFALRLQGAAHRSLRAEIVNLQRQKFADQQMNVVDPVTGLPKRRGIQESLELALASNELTGLAVFEVSNADNIARYCEPEDFDRMMRQLADVLREQCDYQLKAGRWDAQRFVLWGKLSESDAQWRERAQDIQRRLDQRLSEGLSVPDIVVAAALVPQGDDPMGSLSLLMRQTAATAGAAVVEAATPA